MIDSLTTEEECRNLMTISVNELNDSEFVLRLQNIILTELQEKYNIIKGKNASQNEKNINDDKTDLDLSEIVKELKNKLTKIQEAYKSIMSDGYIDDIELATLLDMINTVLDNSYTAKSIATNIKDERTIAIIIDALEQEQRKLQRMQNGIEEIGRKM